MGTILAVGLLALPFLDIASLVKAGSVLGFFPTVAIVIAAGLLGMWLVRHQGLAIGQSVRTTLAAGRLPVVEAFDGACLLIAGGLLLFPGLVSDVIALTFLIPPVRTALRRLIGRRIREDGATVVWTTGADGFPRPTTGGDVIDGDFEEVRHPDEAAGTTPTPNPAGFARCVARAAADDCSPLRSVLARARSRTERRRRRGNQGRKR